MESTGNHTLHTSDTRLKHRQRAGQQAVQEGWEKAHFRSVCSAPGGSAPLRRLRLVKTHVTNPTSAARIVRGMVNKPTEELIIGQIIKKILD